MYAIFTISSKEKKIEVKTEWAKYITEHRNNLLIWLNNKIRLFIGKES